MVKCTFVTYDGLPDLDPDDRLVLDILESRDFEFECQAAVWDSPDVDWSKAGITVLRSTWDYHLKYDKFMKWVDHTSQVTQLFNRPNYIRWNAHKSYLRDLANAGIATVPTHWLERGASVDVESELRRVMNEEDTGKIVVKPAIGLATSGVMVIDSDKFDVGVEHVKNLLADVDVMVQPFVTSVKEHGERALVFINGRYCHAARKTAFQELKAAGEAGEKPVDATVEEVYLAEDAMSAVSELVRRHERGPVAPKDELFLPPPLFARVDLVRGDNGKPMIIELELVEPSLFLGFYPHDAALFADAIAHIIRRYDRLAAEQLREA